MPTPTFFNRSAVWLRRYLLLSGVFLLLIALIHFLHGRPNRDVLSTVNFRDITSHLPSSQVGLGKSTGTSPSTTPWRYPEKSNAAFCQRHKHLESLGLTRKIKYTRRCIVPKFAPNHDRNEITHISTPLITHTSLLDVAKVCGDAKQPQENESMEKVRIPCDTVELPISPPDPQSKGQYTHLIFGVATSYDRLRASKETFAHWLADSGSTLVGMLTNDPNDVSTRDLASLEAEFADARMVLKVVRKRDARYATEQSHALVIEHMLGVIDSMDSFIPTTASTGRYYYAKPYSTGQEQERVDNTEERVHWLAILDDDTFFPSISLLSNTLAAYNHTIPQYLGQLTEAASLLPQGILEAFGGAGIFLSTPLAREMAPHLEEDCINGAVGGDMLIMNCVHRHSKARLERVEGLWQMDLVGDTAGFYESGKGPVLSLHHWKSWHWNPVVDMARVTKICGGACFLERVVFDADPPPAVQSPRRGKRTVAVLNNGYSINFYTSGDERMEQEQEQGEVEGEGEEKGLDVEGSALPDLSKMEQTWDAWPGTDAWRDYEWSLGPFRTKVPRERKKSFWLVMGVWSGGGGGGGGGVGESHGGGGVRGGKELTQVYVHRADEEGGVDEVIELVWLAFSEGSASGR